MNGAQLKNSILQWAIQGKLVEQNPKDEPAQKLLERIAASRNESSLSLSKGTSSTSLRGPCKATKQSKNPTSRIYRENGVWYEQVGTATPKDISDEIPFEIPETWAWCRIGDIFYHTSGKQQSSSNKKGSPQKFITTSNLYWGRFVLDNVKVMNFTDEEIKSCSATKGDLLVCEGGAGYGRSAIWNEDYDICLQNHIHRLRPCVNGICEYVYYFIYLLKETNRLVSVGTAMPGLSANRLKGLILPLPPLAEQKRIVAKLEQVLPLAEEYGAAQEQLDKLNKELPEALKKSILQQAIQGKLVPQNPKDEPAHKLLERITAARSEANQPKGAKSKKSAPTSRIYCENGTWYEQIGNTDPKDISDEIPFDIPTSWLWCRVGNVISLLSGRDLEPSQYNALQKGIPYMTGASNFSNESLIVNRWTNSPITISHKGDLLITCKGTIGTMAFNDVGDVHIARQIMAINSSFMNLNYVKYYLTSYVNELQKVARSMIPGISRDDLLSSLIPIPPLAEQKRIVTKLEQLFKVL